MTNPDPHSELLHLVTFMIASASGLYTSRPITAPSACWTPPPACWRCPSSPASWTPSSAGSKTSLDAERQGSMDPERQRQNIERWVLELAAR